MSSPRRGAADILTGLGARLVVTGVGNLVIAAFIGPAQKGMLATLVTVTAVSSYVLGFGMPGTVPYYVATEKWTLAESNFVSLSWTVVAAAISFWIFIGLRATGAGGILVGLTTLQLVMATATLLLVGISSNALLALKRFRLTAKLSVVAAASNPLLFFIFLAAGVGALPAALWAWIIAQLLVGTVSQAVLLHGSGWRLALPRDQRGALWYGMRSYGWELVNLANLRLDVLMLRLLSTPTATGVYALATQLTEVIWLIPGSAGIAIFPEIAHGADERGAWTARVCRLATSLSLALSVVVAAGASVMIVVFLRSYAAAIPALLLLLPGTIAVAISKVLGSDLSARRLPQALLIAGMIGVVITVVGDIALVPRIGAMGAAITSSVSYTVSAVALVWFFASTTGSRPTAVLPRWADLAESLRMSVHTLREPLARARRKVQA